MLHLQACNVLRVTDRWSMAWYSLAGRWNCIRGNSRYRFHPSRTAADLQQKGKQLLSGVTAATGSSARSLLQADPKPKPSRRQEALAAGGLGGSVISTGTGNDEDDRKGHDALIIGVGVTDARCDETGPGHTKRARLQIAQPVLVCSTLLL